MDQSQHRLDEGTERYDEDGYCHVTLFESEFKSKISTYIPLRKISNGRFSTVYLARDLTFKRYVALKINISDLQQQISEDEITILTLIQQKSQELGLDDNGGIVTLLDSFQYIRKEVLDVFDDECQEQEKYYYCMVFELLGHSVYRLITRYTPKINYNKSIPLTIVKAISRKLLKSVNYLHNVANIIHTDLKPENLAMVYYLPLLSETNYDLEEMLYGSQSQHLFDAKLSTPANTININDFDLLDKQQQSEICSYLYSYGQSQGIDSWDTIRNTIMDNTNFKKKFQKFIKQYGQAEVSQKQQCYCIDGMNIFNLPNIIKTAENIFRLQPLPYNFSMHQQIEKQETNIVKLYQVKTVINNILKDEKIQPFNLYTDVTLINDKQINKTKKYLLSESGIKFQLSNVVSSILEDTLATSCAETLIFDPHKSKSIIKIARSGFHSRILLYQNLQQKENPSNIKLLVDPIKTVDEIKCFGLSNQGNKVYPTMISYYSKQQLIPFSEEMFKIKIIDLGNACYKNHRFSKQIQTVNYRAPEIIVGFEKYGPQVDDFSVGCIIFELITGNVLFTPRKDGQPDKSHHLKQIVQTVGQSGLDWLLMNCLNDDLVDIDQDGIKSFNFTKNLQFRSISTILVIDYGFAQQEAEEIEDFIKPFLHLNPNQRKSCKDMLNSKWLNDLGTGDYLLGYGGRQ